MASGSQSLYSTPTFELFRRGLNVQTIHNFRGLNAFRSAAALTPDWAQDLQNVIVPGWGGLSKFRLPVAMSSSIASVSRGPVITFFDSNAGAVADVIGNIVPTAPNQVAIIAAYAQAPVVVAPGAQFSPNSGPRVWAQAIPVATQFNATFGAGLGFAATVAAIGAPNGTLTVAQDGHGSSNNGTFPVSTVAFPAGAPASHAVLVCFEGSYNSGNPVFTVTDDAGAGNVYVQIGIAQAAKVVTAIFLCLNPKGGPKIITIAQAGGNFAGNSIFLEAYDIIGAQDVAVGPQSFWDFQQANGLRQVITNFGNSLYYFVWDAAGVNLVTPILIETAANDVGPWSMVTANNILFGVNGIRAMKWTGAAWQNDGIQVPLQQGGPQFLANQPGALTATQGGWSWRYAYKNSITGHVGAASTPSAVTGNVGPFKFTLQAQPPNPADAQVDTLVWFRTLDGGGNWYREAEVTIATGQVVFNAGTFSVLGPGAQSYTITDNTSDAQLDIATQAPQLNLPPVSGGKFIAVGQSRVFIANLPGAPQDVIYSGYEQILLGRPEESYPPGNRLRLSIGAEGVAGIGVMQSGVVAFSNTKRIYALRGQVEDISVLAPVGFSAYLEELPYDVGTLCHNSIQATPYGILFWATDRTVQMLSNTFDLHDMSGPVYPVLRRATKGRESFASSAYFNWLEREWYALTVAVDGSVYNNLIIFWALNKDISQMDMFVATVQADWLGTLSTPTAQRILASAAAGKINNVPVSQDTTSGIADLAIIPATAGVLPAFWRGGYFGNDAPYRSKMYRRGLLVTDQDGFKVTKRFVDNREFPITAPDVYGPDELFDGGTFELNRRANRCSIEINFPQDDVSANVLELSVGAIPTSDRL